MIERVAENLAASLIDLGVTSPPTPTTSRSPAMRRTANANPKTSFMRTVIREEVAAALREVVGELGRQQQARTLALDGVKREFSVYVPDTRGKLRTVAALVSVGKGSIIKSEASVEAAVGHIVGVFAAPDESAAELIDYLIKAWEQYERETPRPCDDRETVEDPDDVGTTVYSVQNVDRTEFFEDVTQAFEEQRLNISRARTELVLGKSGETEARITCWVHGLDEQDRGKLEQRLAWLGTVGRFPS